MKIALAYNRKSRGDLEDLVKHKKELKDYCKKNNFEIKYFEEIASSVDENRAEYVKLIKEIKTGKYDCLVVTDLSRLTRNLRQQLELFEILADNNIIIHSVLDNDIIDPNNQVNEMMSVFKGIFNQSAYRETSKKMALGRLQSVRQGKWTTVAPFGYKKNSEMKLEIDESEAPIIRRMFTEIIQGLSVTEISLRFYKEGIRSRLGNKMHPSTIARIVRKRSYIGETNYKSVEFDEEVRIKDTHEKIISLEEFLQVSEIMDNKKKFRTRIRKITSPLDKLLICGLCNKRMQINITGNKRQYIHVQKCMIFNDNGEICQNRGCSVIHIMPRVYQEVSKRIKVIKKNIDLLYEGKNNNSLERLQLELASIEKQIKLKEKEKERLLNYLLNGTIKELAYSDKNKQLEDEINNLKIRSEDLTEAIANNNIANDIEYKEKLLADLTNLKKLHVEEQNRILSNVIDEIIYTREVDEIMLSIRFK